MRERGKTFTTSVKPTARSMPSTAAGFGPHQFVWSPPELARWIEGGRGLAPEDEVDVRLEQQVALRHARDGLERPQRVAHVVEHAGEQHQVERADALGAELLDADLDVLDARSERLRGELERLLRAARRLVPREPVRGDDTLGAPALALEREEAVPRAHVENVQARHVLGKAEQRAAGRAGSSTPGVTTPPGSSITWYQGSAFDPLLEAHGPPRTKSGAGR